MAADHLAEIKKIAAHYKSMDPTLYERLLRHMDQYVFNVTVAVTEAPSGEILQAQGRAQQARKFLQTFAEAIDHNRATP